jgi:CelD/BcsL family acetyltransferase involved in cellulose biosynthesis
VHIKSYRSVSELDQIFREVEEIASKTYQRGLGFGFKDTPEMRGRCELAASKDWLRVFVLHIAGRPCAYWIAMAYRETFWGEHIGFDPAYSRYSPGMYLSLSVIEELCDQKKRHDVTQIDFGLGDAEYKSILSNLSFKEGEVQIYGRTLRGVGIKAFSIPVRIADRLAKRILSKTKLLGIAKRLWRDRAESVVGP